MNQPVEPTHLDFIRDIEAGKDVREALLSYHRRKTGALKIEEIKKSLFADETPQERQSSAGIRKDEVMRAIRLEQERKRKEEQAMMPLEEQHTMMMPAFHLPQSAERLNAPERHVEQLVEESQMLRSQKVEAVRGMPLDALNRPFVARINPYENTVELAMELLFQYRAERGELPAVIILSGLRFDKRPSEHFIVGNRRIPYVYDPNVSWLYDVCVRGAGVWTR